MSGTHWMVESKFIERWPVYTRGNVGEVFPEVVTPLSYELGVCVAEAGWREAYRKVGIVIDGDFETEDPAIIGLFGGYAYLNVAYIRMVGVRAPGSSPEAIDVTFFGEGDPPPYVPKKGDKSFLSSLRILGHVMKVLGTKELPSEVAASRKLVADWEARMPSLDAPTEELLAYQESFAETFKPVFSHHIYTTTVAGIVSGILADAAAKAGDPGLATHLIGAAGDVISASYSQEMYEIAKLVRGSDALMAAFDEGIDGLYEKLQAMPEAEAFNAGLQAFIDRHGHRGPNDWELSARYWEGNPELVLVAIDRMRLAEHDLSPAARLEGMEQRRQEAAAKVLPHLGFMEKGNFKKALKASPFWSQAREATRDRAVRSILPIRRVFRELTRRAAQNGGIGDPRQIAMLRFYEELPAYLNDPASMVPVIQERWALRQRFNDATPPFFITSEAEIPGIEQMEETVPETIAAAKQGDVLQGDPGSPGKVQGRARVVMDPGDARGLQPGEILVAPLTDPAWTPLFLPAAAVVVNVGALMSHAVIVSRELGIPCVVALQDATDLIQDGMLLEVDGATGMVKVLEEA